MGHITFVGKDFLSFQTMTVCITVISISFMHAIIFGLPTLYMDSDMDLSKHHCIVHYINSTDWWLYIVTIENKITCMQATTAVNKNTL